MKDKLRIMTLLASGIMTYSVIADNVCITTPRTNLVVDATKGKELKYLYYGERLAAADIDALQQAGTPNVPAYPVYGMSRAKQWALSVSHADGNRTLQMTVEGVEQKAVDGATTTTIHLKDIYYPLYVDVCYKAYNDVDVIETWTEIKNGEKKSVTLNRFDSAVLPVRRGDVWVSHLYGAWANEGQLSEEPLKPGMMVIENRDGTRNSQTSHAELMLSLDGKARENEGDVIGAALAYSGNYKLRINTDETDYH